MRYLTLLLFLIPLNTFSQVDVNVETSKVGRLQQEAIAREKAAAERLKAEAARTAAMDLPSKDILVPVKVDLNNYTHLALVSVLGLNGRTKAAYNEVAHPLMSSPLTIVNPTENRKLFNKNPLYLKNSKDPNWIYLYYTRSSMGVNELRDLVIRDSKNEIIYSIKTKNISMEQVLEGVINF